MEGFVRSLCVFVSIFFIIPVVFSEDACVKKGPCSCEFSNGTGIDLSSSAKSTFYMTQTYELKNNGSLYDLNTYYYHPCYDVLPKMNASKTNGTCGVPLSLCRHVYEMKLVNGSTFNIDGGVCDFMGSSNVTEFSSDGKSIIYFNGPSSTVVMLVCADTDEQLHVYSLEEPNKIVLAFYTRAACLKQIEDIGRSLGSTLLIIFFSFVIFYLVLGICTKKFLMGATGVEVIPNLGFWSDLPCLVKDGWAFTISGFKTTPRAQGPATPADPNSYDSI